MKNILITGAGKGIGKQVLLDCANNNHFVYAVIKSEKDIINLKKLKIIVNFTKVTLAILI